MVFAGRWQGRHLLDRRKDPGRGAGVMDTLPLAKEQLVDHEYIPVGPLMPLMGLIGTGARQRSSAHRYGIREGIAGVCASLLDCRGACRDRHDRRGGLRWTRMCRTTSGDFCGRRSRVVWRAHAGVSWHFPEFRNRPRLLSVSTCRRVLSVFHSVLIFWRGVYLCYGRTGSFGLSGAGR
jgi:hypothetical protein